jgi:hypothetical protein
VPPVAPATESEALWRLIRAVAGQVEELQARVDDLERRDDLDPLRAELRDLSRDVAGLGDDLRDLLAVDRKSAIEVLARQQKTPAPPRPVPSLGPPREVRVAAWSGAVASFVALGTGLALGLAALLRGC